MRFFFLFFATFSLGQTYSIINEEKSDVSYRGLSFFDGQNFVISGSKNTIGKSNDGGKTFVWVSPTIVKDRDYRDIEMISKDNFLAMGIDSPAYLLETKDGGKNWAVVYENNDKNMFLDAMFLDKISKKIYVIGDPITESKPFILTASLSNLKNWIDTKSLFSQSTKLNNPKEAFFAASGSNIYADDKQVLIVSGGEESNLYRYINKSGQLYSLPKTISKNSGINGMEYNKILNVGYLVGGDYSKPNESDYNFFKFKINKNNMVEFVDTWTSPSGYKSGVAIIDKNKVLVCGFSGVDISYDGGHSWKNITKDSFNTCKLSPDKKYVILLGNNGKIGKLTLQ